MVRGCELRSNHGSPVVTAGEPFTEPAHVNPSSFPKHPGASRLASPLYQQHGGACATYNSVSKVEGKLGVDPFSAFAVWQPNRVFRILKMTSTRAPPRRIQTQSLVQTHTKPTISVEEWEAKAPLLDSATRSINAIKVASENRPLPPKVRLRSAT